MMCIRVLLTCAIFFHQHHYAFVSNPSFVRDHVSQLHMVGIETWRESTAAARQECGDISSNNTSIIPELVILDDLETKVLLQGEVIKRVVDDSEVEFFDEIVLRRNAVCGYRLKQRFGSEYLPTVAIVEVESYRLDQGEMAVRIRTNGRAVIDEMLQEVPYPIARCREIYDDPIVDQKVYEEMNSIADEIHSLVNKTTLIMGHLEILMNVDIKFLSRMQLNFDGIPYYPDDPEESYSELKERSQKSVYRMFREVFLSAYDINNPDHSLSPVKDETLRPLRNLTAISWASLCVYGELDEDVKLRIRALDTTDTLARLKMGRRLLREACKFVKESYEFQLEVLHDYREAKGVEVIDYDLLYDEDDYTYHLGFE